MKDQFLITDKNSIISGHRVYGQALLPGLAYIDIIYQMFRENGHDYGQLELRNLALYKPLIVGPNMGVKLDILSSESRDGRWKITIQGQSLQSDGSASETNRYLSAEMHRNPAEFDEFLDLEQIEQRANTGTSLEEMYEQCRSLDLVHTGLMKAGGKVYTIDDALIIDTSTALNNQTNESGFMFHPALLDSSGIGGGTTFATREEENRLHLPLSCESFRASALLQKRCITRVKKSSIRQTNELIHMTLEFFDEAGGKVGELTNFAGKLVREASLINHNRPVASLPAENFKKTTPSSSGARETIEAEIFLRKLIAERIKKPMHSIGTRSGYYEMGLDSSNIMELVQAVEKKVDTALPPTLLFEYTSIADLAIYLASNYGSKFGGTAADTELEKTAFSPGKTVSITDSVEEMGKTAFREEDVAIIGIAGRYPGAQNIQEFWNNLKEGRDCIGEIPKSRWDYRRFDSLRSPSGKRISKWGGFLDYHDCFDPHFFRISPREAEMMDPQERLFLESCWEALEDAGYTPETLVSPWGPYKRRRVGVFVGVMHKDYALVGAEAVSLGHVFPLSLNDAPIANRVSYYCNFHGPSMAIDTVCSSSLTALHLALQSIRLGECEAALAGGVNLSLHPNKYLTYGMSDLHSSDGRCRTFGQGGDGYVSGEGVGAVLLKPLSKAVRDRDNVYAVVKGSAVNHVGTVSGITVPSPIAQADVIVACLEKTGINPRTVSYVEAHGTGTSLGDPIEMQGLEKAYRHYTDDKQFCSIGSVKSNIGHAESAAGISGLLKLTLQLHHKTLVPSLHSEETNPYIDFEESPFYVQRGTEAWKNPVFVENGREISHPRRGGLSSFGATGSNAHIILEEYRGEEHGLVKQASDTIVGLTLVPLSARDKERLREYAGRLLLFLEESWSDDDCPGEECNQEQERLLHAVNDSLIEILATVVQVEKGEIETKQGWSDLGVDAFLMAQIQNGIRDKLGVAIGIEDLAGMGSVEKVASYIADGGGGLAAVPEENFPGSMESEIQQEPQLKGSPSSKAKKNTLSEVAYTLQVGREAMEERVVFLVRDISELITKLEAFTNGEKDIDNCWQRRVKNNNEAVSLLGADQDYRDLIGKWLAKGKLRMIAELWIKGVSIDFEKLHGETTPGRISLPTYPFAKERYWAPEDVAEVANISEATVAQPASIHPLLQQNTSDLSEQRYSSVFTGEEFFLADHIIKGQRILPAVAYLELARAAMESATPHQERQGGIRLRNVIWARPIAVNGSPVRVHIGLFPEDNGAIGYEIYSDSQDNHDAPVVHSQGSVTYVENATAPALDIAALLAQCGLDEVSADRCYQTFEAMGLEYGPSHRGIVKMHRSADHVLAKLSLPSSVAGTRNHFILHPSLMDSALQAAMGLTMAPDLLLPGNNFQLSKPMLPFALQELEILKECSSAAWTYARYSNTGAPGGKLPKIDIDLCDEHGEICVRIKGISPRIQEEESAQTESTSSPELLLLEPCWQEKAVVPEADALEYKRHHILLFDSEKGTPDSIAAEINSARILSWETQGTCLAQQFQENCNRVFTEIKNILKEKTGTGALIQIAVPAPLQDQPYFSGLAGLLRTALLENPHIKGQLIEIEPGDDAAGIAVRLKENAQSTDDVIVVYRKSKRYVAGWEEVDIRDREKATVWKDHGRYLITGGAGGLGLIFAGEIFQKARKATVYVTGRSKLDKAQMDRLRKLEDRGGGIHYLQVDITSEEAVAQLMKTRLADSGALNGIIHSAGIIRDNFILKKSADEMQQVLAPKVSGLVNIDRATKDLSLDFFILFSSVAGGLGNPGQCDYSSANAFMDHFAGYRNNLVTRGRRQGKTLSINWPLWKDGGMHVDTETEKMMRQRTGMTALRTRSGLQAFYQALAAGQDQILVVEGDVGKLKRYIGVMPEGSVDQVSRAEDQMLRLNDTISRFATDMEKQS